MSEQRDTPATWSDDELEQRLRAVADEVDPVPELVLEQARAAFVLRRLDEELAELVLDSNVDEGAYQVRGDDDLRMLAFRTDRMSIEVQVTRAAGRWSLRGLVTGASGSVRVESAEGESSAPIDERGRFLLDNVQRGLLRLHLTTPDGARVTTSWVSV